MGWKSIGWGCLAMAVGACGGDDDGGGGDGVGANCAARCEAKFAACGHTAAVAQASCPDVCGDQPTEAQLQCAEAKDCAEFNRELTAGEAICGIGETSGSGGAGGGGCPQLSGCACGLSGVVEIGGRCARSCDEACDALSGR